LCNLFLILWVFFIWPVFFINVEKGFMNQVNFRWANSILALALMMLFALKLFAQDKQVDINVDVNKGGGWYTQPWVWIVGAAVFILLLIALLRPRGRD
jgi:hypothetical protein